MDHFSEKNPHRLIFLQSLTALSVAHFAPSRYVPPQMKPFSPNLISGVLISALLLISLPAARIAHADVPRICSGKNFSNCLQLLLFARCGVYVRQTLFSENKADCGIGVRRLVKTLRPKIPAGETNVFAFPHRISALFRDRAAVDFLKVIPSAIQESLRTNQTFRLWDLALQHASGDESRALEWIAVFFQDTQPDPVALEYARIGDRSLKKVESTLWLNALEALSYSQLRENEKFSFVRVYPSIDTQYLNTGFYHFYVVAHLTRSLRLSGRVSLAMAGFTPFLMNLVYETNDIDEVRFANLPFLSRPLPIWDARPFSAKTHTHALADMYAGYLGALFGLGGTALVSQAESFSEFSSTMAADPRGKVLKLYQNFIPAKQPRKTLKESS